MWLEGVTRWGKEENTQVSDEYTESLSRLNHTWGMMSQVRLEGSIKFTVIRLRKYRLSTMTGNWGVHGKLD